MGGNSEKSVFFENFFEWNSSDGDRVNIALFKDCLSHPHILAHFVVQDRRIKKILFIAIIQRVTVAFKSRRHKYIVNGSLGFLWHKLVVSSGRPNL